MFKIKGVQKYLSIEKLAEAELPDFSILIGLNGSGKTHFLKAIQNGSILTSLSHDYNYIPAPNMPRPTHPPQNSQYVYLDNFSITKQIEPSNSSMVAHTNPNTNITVQNNPMLVMFESWRANILAPFLIELGRILLEGDKIAPSTNLQSNSISNIDDFLATYQIEADSELGINISKVFTEANSKILCLLEPNANIKIPHEPMMFFLSTQIKMLSEKLKKTPLEISLKDISLNGSWGKYTLFDPEITQIFSNYRDAHIKNNNFLHGLNENDRKSALSADEFFREFGKPPWEQISEILKSLGFKYEVAPPSSDPQLPCFLNLKDPISGLEINNQDLSNGERQILNTILALFSPDSLRVNLVLPQLLLLDELDAPLHPSALSQWLDLINEQLVKKLGIKCILATHSPITVALSSENSIFEISQPTKLTKISKQSAINKLTSGLPSISVDFSHRLQVIVESDTDARIYDEILKVIKNTIELERSISFMSASTRQGKSETNGGCDVVKNIVNKFCEAGNKSVYGLVDWDLKNTPSERVKVLAHLTHYSIENIILDPFLVACLILREKPTEISTSIKFSQLKNSTIEEIQELADCVQKKVLGAEYSKDDSLEIKYLSGDSIKVSKKYCQMNGHRLEEELLKAYPNLKRSCNNGNGQIGYKISQEVLQDFPKFCPMSIIEVIQEIASDSLK